jgi:hypothetical protein
MIGKWASLDDRLTNGIAMGGLPEHNPELGRCHLWCGSINKHGYGTIGDGYKVFKVHRLAWERAYGPIPTGRQIDHRCFVRHCVRPDHLRLATSKQNNEHLRGAKRNSSSGVWGVFPAGNRWMVKVGHNGKQIYFGTYATLEEAEKVAIARRNELHTYNDLDREEAS